MRHLFKYLLISTIVLCTGCNKSETPNTPHTQQKSLEKSTLSIAAAANLRYALEEMKQSYISEYPEREVNITFGSSGTLSQQIANGAPFDLFLSADTLKTEKLKEMGKTYGNTKVYAYGKVALWSSTIEVSQGLNILTNAKVHKIAIANPELAPYGKSSIESLKKLGLYDKVKDKIIFGENINQTAQFAVSGNADVAFVALSNALSDEMKTKGKYYILSKEESLPIAQNGIIINGENNAATQDFFNYILSEKAKNIWEKYGYESPTH